MVDQNIRGAEATFGRHATLRFMDGRVIGPADLANADALIIRTATRVDQTLLQGSPVRFVGTTSIGTDHLDVNWLDRHQIRWANAPGCNADSAAQYTLAMIWLACQRLSRTLQGQRIGIIGRGNVGSRLQTLLQAFDVRVVASDPPLAELGVPGLVSLDEALSSDIVSLHVPLSRNGAHPTYRFIAAEQMARMPAGSLLVNAARGDVIDGSALLAELESGRLHAALDVWPGEPLLDAGLLERVSVATPHVAGYSLDGKRNGTRMVYQAFCDWAGLQPFDLPDPDDHFRELEIPANADAVSLALDATCFVHHHDAEMRKLGELSPAERASGFDRMRREYPVRRDFHAWTIRCPDSEKARQLSRLGFSLKSTD